MSFVIAHITDPHLSPAPMPGFADLRLKRVMGFINWKRGRERLNDMGLLKRLAKQDPSAAIQLCRRAEAVLQRLPAKGITRSQLAADSLGDAHALDGGGHQRRAGRSRPGAIVEYPDIAFDDHYAELTGTGFGGAFVAGITGGHLEAIAL